jgi:hypothetical protein
MKKFYAHSEPMRFYAILILCALFFTNACKKDENNNASSIENAKQWFSSTNKTYLPNWDKAVIVKNADVNYVMLPSNYNIQANTNNIISYLVIADSSGKYAAKLVEFVNSSVPQKLEWGWIRGHNRLGFI